MRYLGFFVLWLISTSNLQAQEYKPMEISGWYGGINGGVPLGISTFSSFGADKIRAGYTAGLYGGYRFNSIFSAEVSAGWGRTTMSAQECCVASGYWLGSDGHTYFSPVAGMNGLEYADLKSRVSLQQYGVQLNVNLLALWSKGRPNRWTLEVSPRLAAVSTKATIQSLSGHVEIVQGSRHRHLGLGGRLQAGYRLTERLSIGLYSGITYLTGKRMDGIAEYVHRNNYVWESGIRLGWWFGRCSKKGAATKMAMQGAVIQETIVSRHERIPKHEVCPEQTEAPVMMETLPATMTGLPTDTVVDNKAHCTLPNEQKQMYVTEEKAEELPTKMPNEQGLMYVYRREQAEAQHCPPSRDAARIEGTRITKRNE